MALYDPAQRQFDAEGRPVPGSGATSAATGGLPSTDAADFAVASAPGVDPWRYSRVVYCLDSGTAGCPTRESTAGYLER